MRIGIIGAGRVGTAIGIILSARGYMLVGVVDKEEARAQALAARTGARVFASPGALAREVEIVFITTSDAAIAKVAEEIAAAGGFWPGQTVVHMSGALGSSILESAARQGAVVLSIHPLQSFATGEQAVKVLPGSFFSIEGDAAGFPLARRLVEDMGGKCFFLSPGSKPLYHAGACVASNYLVTLVGQAVKLLVASGIPREEALAALLPLVEGTVKNIGEVGIPQALTGPIARGDIETVAGHLIAMRGVADELVAFYCFLGKETVKTALEKGGISRERAEEMGRLLSEALGQDGRER